MIVHQDMALAVDLERAVAVWIVDDVRARSEAQRAAEAVAATANSGRVLDGLAKKLKASLGQFRV